jgi:DNA-binding transcriptional ArsR family regulator
LESEGTARKFALLSDPTRLRIVSSLHDVGEISVGELAASTDIPVASVSQHLNRPAVGGIVARRREGTSILYSIADETIETLCDLVCSSLDEERALGAAS